MEENKKSSEEVAHNYKVTIDAINKNFKFSRERIKLERECEKIIAELRAELTLKTKELFNSIISEECLKNDVKEKNVRTIAGF